MTETVQVAGDNITEEYEAVSRQQLFTIAATCVEWCARPISLIVIAAWPPFTFLGLTGTRCRSF